MSIDSEYNCFKQVEMTIISDLQYFSTNILITMCICLKLKLQKK